MPDEDRIAHPSSDLNRHALVMHGRDSAMGNAIVVEASSGGVDDCGFHGWDSFGLAIDDTNDWTAESVAGYDACENNESHRILKAY